MPEDLRGKATWFGLCDFYIYEDEGSDHECDYCKTFAGQLFAGNQLRQVFPNLQVLDVDTILPNVHMTLWNTDTCKCKLTRVPFDQLPTDWTVYSGEKTPQYNMKTGNYSYK